MDILRSILNELKKPLNAQQRLDCCSSYNISKYMEDMPTTVNVYVENNLYNEFNQIHEQMNNAVDISQTFAKYKDQIYSLLISDEFRTLNADQCNKIIFHTRRCEKVFVINMPNKENHDVDLCVSLQLFAGHKEWIIYE